jgi:hypothetical protein
MGKVEWRGASCGVAAFLVSFRVEEGDANPAKTRSVGLSMTLCVSVFRRKAVLGRESFFGSLGRAIGDSCSFNDPNTLVCIQNQTRIFRPPRCLPFWGSHRLLPNVLRSFRAQFCRVGFRRIPNTTLLPWTLGPLAAHSVQANNFHQTANKVKKEMKKPEEYSVDDVCVLFVSLELGHLAPKIRDNVVDGPLLLSLTETDFVNDLGLSGLQTKRVLRGIDLAKQLSANGGGGSGEELAEAREKIHRLEKENRELKDEVMNLRAALQPEPPAPKPQQYQQQPPPQQYQQPPPPQKKKPAGAPVVREAAKGTARGAVLGAVAGAVAGTFRGCVVEGLNPPLSTVCAVGRTHPAFLFLFLLCRRPRQGSVRVGLQSRLEGHILLVLLLAHHHRRASLTLFAFRSLHLRRLLEIAPAHSRSDRTLVCLRRAGPWAPRSAPRREACAASASADGSA